MLEKPLPKFCVTCKNFVAESTWCELHETAFQHEDNCSYWKQGTNTEEEILEVIKDEREFCECRAKLLDNLSKTITGETLNLTIPIFKSNCEN